MTDIQTTVLLVFSVVPVVFLVSTAWWLRAHRVLPLLPLFDWRVKHASQSPGSLLLAVSHKRAIEQDFFFGPGATWMVADPTSVQFLPPLGTPEPPPSGHRTPPGAFLAAR